MGRLLPHARLIHEPRVPSAPPALHPAASRLRGLFAAHFVHCLQLGTIKSNVMIISGTRAGSVRMNYPALAQQPHILIPQMPQTEVRFAGIAAARRTRVWLSALLHFRASFEGALYAFILLGGHRRHVFLAAGVHPHSAGALSSFYVSMSRAQAWLASIRSTSPRQARK